MKCIFCPEGEEKEVGEADCCDNCTERGLKENWLKVKEEEKMTEQTAKEEYLINKYIVDADRLFSKKQLHITNIALLGQQKQHEEDCRLCKVAREEQDAFKQEQHEAKIKEIREIISRDIIGKTDESEQILKDYRDVILEEFDKLVGK